MRKPVGKRLLPPATVGALPLDSTANKARGAAWRSRWSEGRWRNGRAWQAKHGPDTEPGDALGARARQRAGRVTGACAPRQFQRGAVTTGARSRMR